MFSGIQILKICLYLSDKQIHIRNVSDKNDKRL